VSAGLSRQQSQVDALMGLLGRTAGENVLLTAPLVRYGSAPSSPGVNRTVLVVLGGRTVCFHKPFSGVHPRAAVRYDQSIHTPPIHECAAWVLARELGAPYDGLVPSAVMRSLPNTAPEAGSLTMQQPGNRDLYGDALANQAGAWDAAFFDCLIAQQDRHEGNYKWDAGNAKIGLFDHGYAFAIRGHFFNRSFFLEERLSAGHALLTPSETVALQRVVADPLVFGLSGVLEPDRSAALRDRASRMVHSGSLLLPGVF